MTLSSIMKLALKQLDEAAEDIGEYSELFKSYANAGYMIALRMFLKPRELFGLKTDEKGRAEIGGMKIRRVVEIRDENGRDIPFEMAADGYAIVTAEKEKVLHALCEVDRPMLAEEMDEPMLPQYAQAALADYICYRHLSSGNLAKQSRAEFFRQSFYQQMRMLTPQGAGSITKKKNLYAATDIRCGR